MTKPILCLDFDGVLHSYYTKWQGASIIPDPPVPGAAEFLTAALEHFTVAVYSSRSHQPGGREAMRFWMIEHFGNDTANRVTFPTEKPAAFVTLDDRALTFDGTWPDARELLNFKPWNKR